MAKSTRRAVDPAVLPHPRPCWCEDCKRAYGAEYYRTNRDRWQSEYDKRQRAKRLEMPLHPCQTCGGPASGMAKFCSTECRPGGSRHSTRIGYCAQCGGVFRKSGRRTRCDEHFRGDNNQGRLRGNVYHPAAKIDKVCRWCFGEFTVTEGRVGKLTCSTKCTNALRWHHGRYGYNDRCPLPTCVECGDLTCKPPPPRREDYGLESSTFRCPSCELPKWQTDNGRNARRNAAKRRSDAVAAGERFDVFDLIDRDGDDCHLCGKPVRFDVPYWHPEYGTIDHLVPIADGGEHTMANCAVAHLGCNASRGTRGTVQLRMV